MFRILQTFALGIIICSISTGGRKCNAQLLSAYEQAYGSWNVQLSKPVLSRRRWHLSTPDDANIYTNGAWTNIGRRSSTVEMEDGDLQLVFPSRHELVQLPTINTTTKSVRSVSCILNLEKNGKFSLTLLEGDRGDEMEPCADYVEFDHLPIDNSRSITTHQHQPLKGEWFLTPNPYCVTDRHYDTLLLVSDPRIRRHRHHSNTIIVKATVELRCRLWGRYGGGAVRRAIGFKHGRIRGRMTHGTILIVKEEVKDAVGDGNIRKDVTITREIMGTFGGRALIDTESLNETDKQFHDDCEEGNEDDDDDRYFDRI